MPLSDSRASSGLLKFHASSACIWWLLRKANGCSTPSCAQLLTWSVGQHCFAGPEAHPAEHAVVLTARTDFMPLLQLHTAFF